MPHTADFVVPSRRRAKRRVGTDSDRNLRDRHAEPLLGFHRRHRRLWSPAPALRVGVPSHIHDPRFP